jgi:hypothetical protein
LDLQRVKIKQYEFAIQETMLFLSKPLNKYVDWTKSNTTHDLEFEWPATLNEKRYVYDNEKGKTSRHIQLEPKKTQPSQLPDKSATSPSSGTELTSLEITTIECMRMGFNFLHNCQKYIQAIDSGTYKIPEPNGVVEQEQIIVPPLGSEYIDESKDIPTKPNVEYSSPATKAGLLSSHSRDIADGDLASDPDEYRTSPVHGCDRCHRAFLLVDQLKERLTVSETLSKDLSSKLEKEIKAKKLVQRAKDMIDQEIEEITAELFSRANQMVVDEAWKMDQLQTTNRELKKQVGDLRSKVKEKENELAQVTKCLYDLQHFQMQLSNYSTGKEKPEIDSKERKNEFIHSIISGFDQFHSSIAVDGYIFQEFQDFIRIVGLSTSQVSTQAYQSIHASTFMRRSMIESVEPCLFYAYQPSNQFKNVGPGLSQSFKKKLLDFCIRGQVHISRKEGEPSSPNTKEKCMMCTISRECEYKISLGPLDGTNLESFSCCRFCRDRILASQDFFSFITHLASAKHSGTILSLFKKVLWLKRRMALAVLGSCSLFETELSAILGPGGGGDWEKDTDIAY